ncbi:MAG: sigma-70 family RNA polymerase sigma factor [Actinomycetota bacterium]|nr:sigma-70 family RNA polymerase sigma factor [Actinomycetota bacterium]
MSDARFAEVYKAYHWHVYAYCLRRTSREMVDDAVADTFLTAWRKVDDLPAGADVLPWLYSVAYRVLGRQWRSVSRRKKLAEKLAGAGMEYVIPPEMFVVSDHENQQVARAVSRLKIGDREILRLAVWEDLDRPQIAMALGISTDAVRQRLHEARKRLASEYERLERNRIPSPAAERGGTW